MKDYCNLPPALYYPYREYDSFLALYCRSICIGLYVFDVHGKGNEECVYVCSFLSYHDGLIVQENILLASVATRLNLICQWIVEVTVETELILCLYVTGSELLRECGWERDTFHSPPSGYFSNVSENGCISGSRCRKTSCSLIARLTVVPRTFTMISKIVSSNTFIYRIKLKGLITAYAVKILFIHILSTD